MKIRMKESEQIRIAYQLQSLKGTTYQPCASTIFRLRTAMSVAYSNFGVIMDDGSLLDWMEDEEG